MERLKFQKFINRILTLADSLEAHRREAAIQHQTNLYYYLQKESELSLLFEAIENATNNLKFAENTNNTAHIENATKRLKFTQDIFNTTYKEVFARWVKDSRWLHKYLTNSPLENWPEKAEDLKSSNQENSKPILL